MQVVVGRLGRAHGIRGELLVDVRTDEPELRFAAGSQLMLDPQGRRVDLTHLTVVRARSHRGRLVVAFEEVSDRSSAEGLQGCLLLTEVDERQVSDSPDEFYDWQLIGLDVVNRGTPLGQVQEVRHSPAQDLLVVKPTNTADAEGRESLIPFVAAMVLDVDLSGRTIYVDLPDGLLELAEGS